MKYIMFERGVPVLFPDFVDHSQMAHRVGKIPTSAGFVRLSLGGKINCYGESISLSLPSDPERDAIIIIDAFFRD